MSRSADTTASRSGGGGWATVGVWLREILIVVVGALVASTLLRLFVAQMFVIPSGSMENTLQIGDRVAVQKLVGFERGDVVVFRDTLNWLAPAPEEDDPLRKALIFLGLAPDESTNHLIKRVVGVAGDHVSCCDAQGRVTVNGVALNEGTYLYTDPVTGRQVDPSAVNFDVVVPEGTVFVMGDHRNNSQDSRCHLADDAGDQADGTMAFVPVENVVGTAIAVVYPFDRMQTLTRPETYGGIPAGQEPPSAPVVTGPDVIC